MMNQIYSKKTSVKLLEQFATGKKVYQFFDLFPTLPDPDEILKQNNYDYNILRNLLLDPHLYSVVTQRKDQVKQLGWEISYEGSKSIQDEVVNIIQEINLQQIIENVLDAVLFGFSVLEIKWEIKNGKIIPVFAEQKPQEWFIFTRENELRLRRVTGGMYKFEEGEALPDFKFVLAQNNPSYINPYGEKVLSKCFWAVTLKRAGMEYWQTMVERYGMPFLIGRYKLGATEADKTSLLNSLTDMVQNNIAIFEELLSIEIKEPPRYEVGDLYRYLADFYNNEISKAVLTVTLTTEMGKVGSYAATSVHRDMMGNMGVSDKKLVEGAINKIISYYIQLNYGLKDAPKIKLSKKESVIEASVERDKILMEMGVKFTREYFMKKYNLGEADFGGMLNS
ncbi:MAG: phage portal protein family protein [Ignavibacteriaceae bacterium]